MDFSRLLARLFPVPRTLTPHAAGVDITDASIKWMLLVMKRQKPHIHRWGEIKLEAGVVEGGMVKDVHALAQALKKVRSELGGTATVHASLPEEGAFVFSMHVPSVDKTAEVASMIEFELVGRVPIPVQQIVYDYDVIERHQDGSGSEIGVVAFPQEMVTGYVEAFEEAKLTLLSLELEARSIARAVSREDGTDPVTLLVDTGKSRTGFAILKNGRPIFTSTVDVGGKDLTRVVMETLGVDEAQAQTFKNEEGLIPLDATKAKATEAVEKVAAVLADEVERHYRFWDTRRNEHGERVTPVEQVYVVGGSTNLRGLDDFIAGRVHARTERPNVWRHVMDFNDDIPPIDFRDAFQYATAIGLALRAIL